MHKARPLARMPPRSERTAKTGNRRKLERTGTIVSGALHVALLLWVILGDWLFQTSDLEPVEIAQVSIMSESDFQSMVAAAPKAADTPVETPPEQPQPAQPESTPPPQPETPPEPVVVDEPLPQDLPVEAVPQPLETPDPVAPLAENEQPIPVPLSSDRPKPRPVDRVAAVPVDTPTDAPEIADTPTPEVTDQPAPDAQIVEEQQPEAAPEEATTQIVTEAVETEDTAPQLAPTTSLKPRSRPVRVTEAPAEEPAPETPPAETPPETPPEDAVADAVAAAVAEAQDPVADAVAEAVAQAAADSAVTSDTGGQGTAASGPPLTGGELDGMKVAVNACWNVGSMSMEALRTTVVVRFNINPDGKPDAASVELIDSTGGSGSSVTQAFETARRAIIRCGARGFPLPPEKYETWKVFEIEFDPDEMRLR